MKTGKKKELKIEKYSLNQRALIAGLTALPVSFVFFLFGPIDIYANNMQEFLLTYNDIIGMFLLAFFISFVAMFALLMLLNKFALNIVSAILLSCLASTFIDNTLFSTLSFSSGDLQGDDFFTMVKSIVVYVVVAYVFVMLSLFFANRWKNLVIYICVLFVGMNGVSLFVDYTNHDLIHDTSINGKYSLTTEGINEVSQEENIIYIVFDRFDTEFYDRAVEQDEGLFDGLDGFTFYDSGVSKYSRTFPAVTHLATGTEYSGDITPKEYFDTAYKESPFLNDLKSNGYNIDLYVNRYYEYSDAENVLGIANNTAKINGYTLNKTEAFKYFAKLSFARNFTVMLPRLLFKNACDGTIRNISRLECDSEVFEDNDAYFRQILDDGGLTVSGSDKNFKFIYMHGSHTPYTIGSDGHASDSSNLVTQTIGAFSTVREYLDYLKQLGVYDNSTIIITGDHGYAHSDDKKWIDILENGITTCMLVKPRNAQHKPVTVSHSPVSVDNIIPFIVKDAKLKTSNTYGTPINEVADTDAVKRTIYHSRFDSVSHKLILDEYEISGDARKLENWNNTREIKTGMEFY